MVPGTTTMVPLAGAGDDVGDDHAVCLDGGAGHEDASLAISGGAVAAVIWKCKFGYLWMSPGWSWSQWRCKFGCLVDVTWMELVSMEMQVWLSLVVLWSWYQRQSGSSLSCGIWRDGLLLGGGWW